MLRILVAMLLLSSLMMNLCAQELMPSVWLEKEQPAPYSGLLMERAKAEEMAGLLANYNIAVQDSIILKKQLEEERAASKRFYKRPSFWIPVSAVMFSAGLFIGTLNR